MQTYQQQDYELWKEWKRTNSPIVLKQLVDRLQPLMQREVRKWSTTVPVAALESKARTLTVEALKTYDPSRGAAIGTHVTSRLRKLSRFVYPYQNIARLPENKQLLWTNFQVAQNKLIEDLGRDPTAPEMAKELGWAPKKVKDFQRSFGVRELVESEGILSDEDPQELGLVDFYYHGLAPEDQRLFEDITGYQGARVLNNQQLVRKYNLTQGQLSYRKRKFKDAIQRIQRGQY